MYISLILCTTLLSFCRCRTRLNAKEIEKNFDGIHQEIVEIKKNLQYYHKRVNKLDGKSRNDTVIYNKLVERLNHLQYELDRIKVVQQRELKEKLRWKTQAENNSRLIYDFKMGLQNKINENQNLLTKRIERLEQQYVYGQRSILNLEEKINRETTKNQRLSSELQILKSSIRLVYNNMTASINKLRRKHDWMASRFYNKSIENTEMMRHFQRYAEELQKQIFSLQKRASTEEKEAPFRLKDMLMSLLYETEKEQKMTTARPTTATRTITTTTPTTTRQTSTTKTLITPTKTTNSTKATTPPTTKLSSTDYPTTTTTSTTTSKSTTTTMPTSSTTATKTTTSDEAQVTSKKETPKTSSTTMTSPRTQTKLKSTTFKNLYTTQVVLSTEKPAATTEEERKQQATDTTSKFNISRTDETDYDISTTMFTPTEVKQDTDSIDIDQPLANGVFLDLFPDIFDAEDEQGETFAWENDEN